MHVGRLTLIEPGGTLHFGPGGGDALHATVTIDDPRVYRCVAFNGSLGAGEAYVQGWWRASDLSAVARLFLQNAAALTRMDSGWGRLLTPLAQAYHWARRNTPGGSRRNIAAHYDLGNEFYRLWLDDTLTYSAGIFESPETTMRAASIAKLDRICRKLRLSHEHHVLEIGAGWGSFALHAAREYGCRVTTTTISRRQFELARERIAEARLQDRITLLLEDYRDLTGEYDCVVSIEMIEAVGHQFYDTYFRKISDLLAPAGQACIQAITVADRYYEQARRAVDFIKRYIFPGSCIPSIGAMTASVARASDMTLTHLEDITPHYATTLQRWCETFLARQDDVRRLGLSAAFVRMWEFYLRYCEAGFTERTIGTVQMVLGKPHARTAPPLGAL